MEMLEDFQMVIKSATVSASQCAIRTWVYYAEIQIQLDSLRKSTGLEFLQGGLGPDMQAYILGCSNALD